MTDERANFEESEGEWNRSAKRDDGGLAARDAIPPRRNYPGPLRYTKEDILARFAADLPAPEDFTAVPGVTVDEPGQPFALAHPDFHFDPEESVNPNNAKGGGRGGRGGRGAPGAGGGGGRGGRFDRAGPDNVSPTAVEAEDGWQVQGKGRRGDRGWREPGERWNDRDRGAGFRGRFGDQKFDDRAGGGGARWGPGGAGAPAPGPAAPAPAPPIAKPPGLESPPKEEEWVYLDHNGLTQGPFGSAQMLKWYEAGHFARFPDLPIKRGSDAAEMKPLSSLMRDSLPPFSPRYRLSGVPSGAAPASAPAPAAAPAAAGPAAAAPGQAPARGVRPAVMTDLSNMRAPGTTPTPTNAVAGFPQVSPRAGGAPHPGALPSPHPSLASPLAGAHGAPLASPQAMEQQSRLLQAQQHAHAQQRAAEALAAEGAAKAEELRREQEKLEDMRRAMEAQRQHAEVQRQQAEAQRQQQMAQMQMYEQQAAARQQQALAHQQALARQQAMAAQQGASAASAWGRPPQGAPMPSPPPLQPARPAPGVAVAAQWQHQHVDHFERQENAAALVAQQQAEHEALIARARAEQIARQKAMAEAEQARRHEIEARERAEREAAAARAKAERDRQEAIERASPWTQQKGAGQSLREIQQAQAVMEAAAQRNAAMQKKVEEEAPPARPVAGWAAPGAPRGPSLRDQMLRDEQEAMEAQRQREAMQAQQAAGAMRPGWGMGRGVPGGPPMGSLAEIQAQQAQIAAEQQADWDAKRAVRQSEQRERQRAAEEAAERDREKLQWAPPAAPKGAVAAPAPVGKKGGANRKNADIKKAPGKPSLLDIQREQEEESARQAEIRRANNPMSMGSATGAMKARIGTAWAGGAPQGAVGPSLRDIQAMEEEEEAAEPEPAPKPATPVSPVAKAPSPAAAKGGKKGGAPTTPAGATPKAPTQPAPKAVVKGPRGKGAPAAKAAPAPAPPPEEEDDALFWGEGAATNIRVAPTAPTRAAPTAPAEAWSGPAATDADFPSLGGPPKESGRPNPTPAPKAKSAAPAKKKKKQQSKEMLGASAPPKEISDWCRQQLKAITGSDDTTVVEFIWPLQSAEATRDYVVEYLGRSPAVNAFANEFLRRKADALRGEESDEDAAPPAAAPVPAAGKGTGRGKPPAPAPAPVSKQKGGRGR